MKGSLFDLISVVAVPYYAAYTQTMMKRLHSRNIRMNITQYIGSGFVDSLKLIKCNCWIACFPIIYHAFMFQVCI